MIKKTLPYFFAAITILLIVIFGFSQNFRKTEVDTLTRPTPVPTRRLQDIEYKKEDLSNGWVKITSQNYGFEIVVPEGTRIDNGGGFSKDYPDDESVSLSLSVPADLANTLVNIGLSFNNSDDLRAMVEKLNVEYLSHNGIVKPTSQVKQRTINDITGYEISFAGNNPKEKTIFFTLINKYQLSISYRYPWSGIAMTGKEKMIGQKIVESLRYLPQ